MTFLPVAEEHQAAADNEDEQANDETQRVPIEGYFSSAHGSSLRDRDL